jgi:hypothetical protein
MFCRPADPDRLYKPFRPCIEAALSSCVVQVFFLELCRAEFWQLADEYTLQFMSRVSMCGQIDLLTF